MVKVIKKNSSNETKLKKNIILVLGLALLITLIVLVVVVVKGDFGSNNAQSEADTTIIYKEGLTFAPTKEDKNNLEEDNNVTENIKSENDNAGVNTPADNRQNTSSDALPDSSGWSTSQIISKAADAVNKTKAYTGNLTVNHSEGFTADVKECTGGEIVKSIANLMIGWVVKPVDEVLSFQNGKAVNSEGETVPIILPKRNGFSLSKNGVTSATVQQTGNEYIIKINLIEESVGMYEVPTHNASAIGYLDVGSFDISFMEIDSADIVYKGSSIELRINADGFVTYANYKIPLYIKGSAHKGSISGSAVFEGVQTEEWKLNW